MSKLAGKVAVVTGASSGIGAATALALAGEGAHVVLQARRKERMDELAGQLAAHGGRVLVQPLDITQEADVHAAMHAAHTEMGRIDVLFNNAGVMLNGPIEGADTDEWRRMVDINILGLMYATQAVLPIMREQQSGHIVNVSSVAGRYSFAGASVYNATKWGVIGFSDALRKEVQGHNIRTTIIEPGLVDTELFSHITDEQTRAGFDQYIKSLVPLRGEDIAAAVVYAVTQPPHVSVNEILIRPTLQER